MLKARLVLERSAGRAVSPHTHVFGPGSLGSRPTNSCPGSDPSAFTKVPLVSSRRSKPGTVPSPRPPAIQPLTTLSAGASSNPVRPTGRHLCSAPRLPRS